MKRYVKKLKNKVERSINEVRRGKRWEYEKNCGEVLDLIKTCYSHMKFSNNIFPFRKNLKLQF